ncbi:MAG TPA: FAD/NAD(P)-binding oxidoreductase [Verrucomicrobiae bacterium]|nr:FAD/NAD(P)-binding oxidoreductase [Verrucomicrobiae bacterium]
MSKPLQPFDVLVVGGGPAGVAAAVRAAECAVRVGIVDDNLALGGQIWRADRGGRQVTEAEEWRRRVAQAGVTALFGMRVFHQPEPGVLFAESATDFCELRYRTLVLATGARERFLPFPGWTLPNVMGAGGLQAMVKVGLPVRGKRVVIAGSGPLLLAVAAYLRRYGAEIPLICEQATWRQLARFSASLIAQPQKILQALQLRKEIAGIRFLANSWPQVARGHGKLESVTISCAGKSEDIACDYLACGFHLLPNNELASLLGCEIRHGCVQVDEYQQTTIAGVFCAGEPTGIGGVELSLIEGDIAGLAATGRRDDSRKLFGARRRFRRFASLLNETFALRDELRSLPSPETLVCRCEDVPHARLRDQSSWRAAKLHTRCGMGACQGRICGPATEFLFRWNPDSVRPPVFPARVENLAAVAESLEPSAVIGGYPCTGKA